MNPLLKLRSKTSIVRLCSRPNIFFEESLIELERYARGESWEREVEGGKRVFGLFGVLFAVQHCSNQYTDQAVVSLLQAKADWRDQWERGVLYRYWATLLEARCNAIAETDFVNGKRQQKPRFLNLGNTGFTLGNCLALGWFEEVKTLACRMNTALDRGWFFDGACGTFKRRTQHFVLRLAADWQGWPERKELPCMYDVPVFNDLIEQWQTPDVQALNDLLLQALDRHAEQTQLDTEDNDNLLSYDCNSSAQIHNPMEVLAVLRLRETLGLPNPEMPKHPVTDTPLGRALPPASVSPKDDLLDRVLTRVRREYPDLLTA